MLPKRESRLAKIITVIFIKPLCQAITNRSKLTNKTNKTKELTDFRNYKKRNVNISVNIILMAINYFGYIVYLYLKYA